MKKHLTKEVAKTSAEVTDSVVTKVKAPISEDNISALKDKLKLSPKNKTADSTNTEKALQKIQYNRELLWIYPEDCITTIQRKVFRQKARNQIRRWESQALKLEGKLKEAKMAEIKAYRAIVLSDPDRAL